VIAAIVISLTLMMVDHRWNHLERVRSALSVVTYPLQYVVSLPFRTSDWLSERSSTREELFSDRDRLRKENLELHARLQKFKALEAENVRLRGLLDSSFSIGDRVLIAELIAVDLDLFRQQVLINKGSRSGIYIGQPVLDANAVMGQVTHVTPNTATVLLITDAQHALPIQVNRNGLRTIAFGTGIIDRLELPQLPNNAEIEVGDLLVTSGFGGLFPAGYPVARVTEVRHEPGRPFATIFATPTAHLERTNEVLLVWQLDTTNSLEPQENTKESEQ
jgi:rod shape-determining protein MreC